MKLIYDILNWVFTLGILLIGFKAAQDNFTLFFPFFFIALLVFLPARNYVFSKTGRAIGSKERNIYILVSLFIFGLMYFQEEAGKKAELEAQQVKIQAEQKALQTKARIDNFNANRQEIIANITDAIRLKEYGKAKSLASKHLVTDDSELKSLYNKSKKLLDGQLKAAKEQELLAMLQKIPSSSYQRNQDLYKQLYKMYPDNKKYKVKYEKYHGIVVKAEQEAKEKKARGVRINKLFSGWDGSLRALEKVIKRAMNDPDSYEHVDTRYWDMGDHLVVRTVFRGKNAFGGTVKNSMKAKVDLNGNVLRIIE